MRQGFVIFIALCLCVLMAHGQSYHFKNFTIDDGLPSNELYKIIQDSEGFLWFSTDRGVARYNGYEFEVFTTEEGLSDNVVFDILEDDHKRIWFSGLGQDFAYYDMQQKCLVKIPGKIGGFDDYPYKIRSRSDTVSKTMQDFYEIKNDTLITFSTNQYFKYQVGRSTRREHGLWYVPTARASGAVYQRCSERTYDV